MKTKIYMFERESIEILNGEGNHSLPLHSHECFCFGIIKQGKVHFKIGNKEKLLLKGMAFIIPSNVGITINSNQNYSYTTICLKNEIRDHFMKCNYKEYFLEGVCLRNIDLYCSEFIKHGLSECLLKEISRCIEHVQEKKIETKDINEEIVEKAKDYIRNHICDKFCLDDICKYVYVSKYHFVRIFKKYTGVSPNQYYIQAKLFVAKQLLKQNIQEIKVANELNFSDQSYLCNIFKRRMGISIKEFKRNYQLV